MPHSRDSFFSGCHWDKNHLKLFFFHIFIGIGFHGDYNSIYKWDLKIFLNIQGILRFFALRCHQTWLQNVLGKSPLNGDPSIATFDDRKVHIECVG